MFHLTVMIEETPDVRPDFVNTNFHVKGIVRIDSTATNWESCLANLRNAVDYIDTGHVGGSNV